MEAINASIDMKLLLPALEQFRSATDIAPIRDEAHYARMCTLLGALLDEVSADEAHPLMGLVDIVGNLVADYETRHHTLPEANGVQALKFLMTQHRLKQGDLPEIGSQGVVSGVLTGKRDLNIVEVRALGARFGVSSASFV